MLPQPTLRHVADLTIKLDPIVEMGQGQGGTRRIIPIIGGQVSGPAFSGEIMNVGADWQTILRLALLNSTRDMRSGQMTAPLSKFEILAIVTVLQM